MSVEFTEEWLANYCKRTGKTMPMCTKRSSIQNQDPAEPQKRPKYGNQKVEIDGTLYDSKHEAKVARMLLLQLKAGEYRGLAKQVSFMLPGGVKYIADFVIFNNDGTYTVVDAKSEATRKDKVYRLKKRQMKACLDIEIQEM